MIRENDIIEIKSKEKYSEIAQYCNDNGLCFERQEDGKYVVKNARYVMSRDEALQYLRNIRAEECFPIINRGQLWYATLSAEQIEELDKWYKEWLGVTDRYSAVASIESIMPAKPKWLK